MNSAEVGKLLEARGSLSARAEDIAFWLQHAAESGGAAIWFLFPNVALGLAMEFPIAGDLLLLILSVGVLVLNIWGTVEVGFLMGSPDANRYGPPRANVVHPPVTAAA